ncbi:MAG: ribonuclease P protein component [Terriglobia bacterium]
MTVEGSPCARRQESGLRTSDFDHVYRSPTRRRRSLRFMTVARPNECGRTRWGISVKARLGSAVVRNRVRRRLREILRRAQLRLPAGWDVVVQPRRSDVARADFAALSRELEVLLQATLRTEEGE